MKNRFLNSATYDAPTEGAPGADDPSPESVLFPTEKPEGKPDDVKADDVKPEGDGGAWKEFEPDAGKSEAENAAAKAEHDKTKPADWKEYEADPKKSEAENAAAKAEHDKTKPADDKDPANVVPADGKYALTMPEGVKVDQELLDALGPKFAAKKMTQAEAQGLADEFIKIQTARAAKQNQTWADTISNWADDAKADKDMGGDKWDTTAADAKRAIKVYGTPALKEYLEATGGGNHPELIRFMSKVGNSVKDDEPPKGGLEGAGGPAEPAHVLFPNDTPKG